MVRLALALCLAAAPVQAKTVTVFAAASLQTALDRIAADWSEVSGHEVVVSYGGSSALARQIEAGAPADVFLSAAIDWMDVLEEAGLIVPGSRRDLLGNRLVLIATGSEVPEVAITPELDLLALLNGGRLSMALVDAVPAGQYGKAALQSLGLWSGVEGQLAQADNVRAAMDLVVLGEAPLGIVYATDAAAAQAAGQGISVIGTFPADSHPPIIYPVAQISDSAAGAAFLTHLSAPEADAVFAAEGFAILD